MRQQEYWQLSGLEHVYLEDSYVLDVREERSSLEFLLELVLTEDHPDYTSPEPGEQYCYRKAQLVFPNVQDVRWLEKTATPYRDATGSIDYGNIDALTAEQGHYRIEGDWGVVEVESSAPTLKLVEGVEADAGDG